MGVITKISMPFPLLTVGGEVVVGGTIAVIDADWDVDGNAVVCTTGNAAARTGVGATGKTTVLIPEELEMVPTLLVLPVEEEDF